MKRFRRYILLLIIAMGCVCTMSGAQRVWEEVNRFPAPAIEQTAEHEDIAVTTTDGYVYITVRQQSTVKVFTILGQLIVQQNLKPGIYRYRLQSRGIYLLKAGSLTRRLTV